jgi:hypothetical protein
MNTQILRFALIKRLSSLHPDKPVDAIAALAVVIENTNAYAADDAHRIVAVGTRGQLSAARELAPALAHQVSNEMVASASASSSIEAAPLDRARARLRAMGVDMDAALDGTDESRSDFYGLDLNNMPPKDAA